MNCRHPFVLMLILLTSLNSCSPPIWNRLQKRAAVNQGIAEAQEQTLLATDSFKDWKQHWVEEAEAPARYRYVTEDSCLDIIAPKGLTLWYKTPFVGNHTIRYHIRAVAGTDSLDRCSDLNCFWMATDPLHPDSLFARKSFRNGTFGKYYSLKLYYLGFGGNGNTTTRFRKYDGDYDAFLKASQRPNIVKEYTDSEHLIKANHWYSVVITILDGKSRFWLDGALLFEYQDPEPLQQGWFGLRTTQNHLQVRAFSVTSP
jgi:rhamnogalacturonan endolyase